MFDKEDIVVVVQPAVPATVQVGPVKPLIHIHEHSPLSTIDEPPFRHMVLLLDWHSWTAADGLDFCLLRTRNSRGITTAAAIIIKIINRTRTNPQRGRPQQRRRLWVGFSGVGEAPKPVGHVDVGRGVPPRLEVASPGGGKAAIIPERPDCRWPSFSC